MRSAGTEMITNEQKVATYYFEQTHLYKIIGDCTTANSIDDVDMNAVHGQHRAAAIKFAATHPQLIVRD